MSNKIKYEPEFKEQIIRLHPLFIHIRCRARSEDFRIHLWKI